jgi:hypothetical protein
MLFSYFWCKVILLLWSNEILYSKDIVIQTCNVSVLVDTRQEQTRLFNLNLFPESLLLPLCFYYQVMPWHSCWMLYIVWLKYSIPKNVIFQRLATALFLVKQDRKCLQCVIFVACLFCHWPCKFFNILLMGLELIVPDIYV